MSSFQKKRTTISLPGTKLQNGQQLVSTGNPALDHIMGGGLPIGSILLIEEDKFGRYSDCLIKYFLAEGVVHKHGLFVGDLDADPVEFVKKLPLPVVDTNVPKASEHLDSDGMRIAWRYNNLEKIDSVQGNTAQAGHYFDLSQHITDETFKDLFFTPFPNGNTSTTLVEHTFSNGTYAELLHSLSSVLKNEMYCNKQDAGLRDSTSKNLLRISLRALGSPLWWDDNFSKDFCRFLITLKALIRNSLSVCCLSIPTHLFQHFSDNLIHRVRNLVDYSIELESFAGSDKETNPVFKEYHGLIHIRKLSAVNTFAAYTPEIHDLAFKLRRKRFVIEKLHLPPELQEPDGSEPSVENSVGCGSASKKNLDF